MPRVFLVRCDDRKEGRIAGLGGFFMDSNEWHFLSRGEVVRLIEGGISFFTGADDSFAQVHTPHRRAVFLQTNPDGSLADNLDQLERCTSFARIAGLGSVTK
jgi:hypothetical protein